MTEQSSKEFGAPSRLVTWMRILTVVAVFAALAFYLVYGGVDLASAGCETGH
jgi:Ni,Fe-hydrogenase I cytochrome b subunit